MLQYGSIGDMAQVEFLYLSMAGVIALGLKTADVIRVVEAALAQSGKGRVQMPSEVHLAPRSGTETDSMACVLSQKELAIAWVGLLPENCRRQGSQTTALLMMNEVETGAAIVDVAAT